MPKTTFTAVDPNGTVHKRTSLNRTYTHTVVAKRSYEADLQRAVTASATASDASNFAYYTKVAAGNDPHAATNWLAKWPEKHTPEAIAAEDVRVQAQNQKRQQDAADRIAGHATVASYCAAQREARLAQVEQRKAEGYYDAWINLGWCGRPDLAQALAGKNPGAVILTATVKA